MFLNKKHEEAYQLLNENKYLQAVEKYSACIEETPERPELYSERAVAFIHLNEKEKSLRDFDKSLALEPEYAYRYASRGHARDHFGDIDGAIEDYEKAVQLDPKDDIIHNNLGVLLEKKGYMQMAKESYDRSDKLRKAENAVDELVDSVDGINQEERKAFEQEQAKMNIVSDENSTPENQGAEEKIGSEFKKIFTDKKQRSDFWTFIKNGFKMNKKS